MDAGYGAGNRCHGVRAEGLSAVVTSQPMRQPARLRRRGRGHVGTSAPERFRLKGGDIVVFTGELSLPREAWVRRALEAGLAPLVRDEEGRPGGRG